MRRLRSFIRIISVVWLGLFAQPLVAGELTVFAAASTKTALDDVAKAWAKATGNQAVIAYAGSSSLARQIQQGAPADVFISANVSWMDALDTSGLIEDGTRRALLGNRLVLISHDKAAPVQISAALDLKGMLGEDRLAMALVDAVPAGIYGKASLEALGLWTDVQTLVAQTDNVRAALALVATGEAPLGIVYATDAVAEPRVNVIGRFPNDSHPPIIYPAAAVSEGNLTSAKAFLDFLGSNTARSIFQREGFGTLGK